MKTNAVFCTAAENNSNFYINRVKNWHTRYYDKFKEDSDFFCFIDGKIDDISIEGIEFINITPKLGRSSIQMFEGYKRSFAKALEYLEDYQNILLIENDVIIRNFEKLNEYRLKPGCYSSIDRRYNFIETAMMILNDKNEVRKMKDHFKDNIYTDEGFEYWIQDNCKFEYPFKSIRVEGHRINEQEFDYLCQT